MSAVPVERPIIVTRPKPQLRVEQGGRVSVLSQIASNAALFGALTLGVFFTSSLAGQVMVEQARRDGIRATERARSAAKAEALVRNQIEEITRSSAIDEWALAHGFVAPEVLTAKAQGNGDAEKAH